MACLALKLLGPFQATLDGQAVEFATDKVRALLAYLAVESDRPHARESLAGLLWPDYAESSARQSLTQALFSLRTAVGDRAAGDRAAGVPSAQPPFLRTMPGMVQFNGESDHWLDVAALSEDLARRFGAIAGRGHSATGRGGRALPRPLSGGFHARGRFPRR